ncbi:hypothetical protein NQ152_00830 [Microbacterium sp. zg.B48]|uniref:hypothetical protein n=1 Tax=unclassified Microbacterium TaxID=2609290 RepID=UPI00214AA27D|nr:MULTISPECIES: hypothetical protein [unclassified Microbacterium]MCR2762044.1 hypothetical protein [Microbacterium sp. zg.B48]MCR2809948.1 hypothetical protein [Microbacterium sp. zg.B185]WIM17747.1 hypothetical protein QNO12_08925 [Microbacterium sp. zg-B185]
MSRLGERRQWWDVLDLIEAIIRQMVNHKSYDQYDQVINQYKRPTPVVERTTSR